MPPATPRKSCLASSSSSSECSSPTDSITSTTATPPTPSLECTPFARPKSKKSVRFANPIREYQLVSASFSIVTEGVPAIIADGDAALKKGKKRKECQSSNSSNNMCHIQQHTSVKPCHRSQCSTYDPYVPPLLPPPTSPLPSKPRKKSNRQPQLQHHQLQIQQQSPPKKKIHSQVDVHLTFNFDENGFAYPSVPSLTTTAATSPFTYSQMNALTGIAPYALPFQYAPPPYLGSFNPLIEHPPLPVPRQLRRKPSFEMHRGNRARSIDSFASSESFDSASFQHLQALRGVGRSSSSGCSSSNTTPSEYSIGSLDALRAEQQEKWEEERYIATLRRREMEKRRARERKPRRMDLGDGLYGSSWSEQMAVPNLQQACYSFEADEGAYF